MALKVEAGEFLHVKSPNLKVSEEEMVATFAYPSVDTEVKDGHVYCVPTEKKFEFKTQTKVPKTGFMLVGLGGNNGTTVMAGILANKHKLTWRQKTGTEHANFYGSVTQHATVRVGALPDGKEVYVPFKSILPMVDPCDMPISGWDITGVDMASAMERAEVIDVDLQHKLHPMMKDVKPLPSIYYPDFIAANQVERADNVIPGTRQEQVDKLRKDMRDFKMEHGLDKVVILWTATTERFVDIIEGVNDTADNILKSVKENHSELSPSNLFAIASVLEGNTYINGSPQNTLVPGVIDLATKHKVHIAGDDFKTGQTKIKSVLVDWLTSAGIKPVSIVSYNHLGNNDGRNLSAPAQFRSKEISKSNVVSDVVQSSFLLYNKNEETNEEFYSENHRDLTKPDHCVVIKYIPYVGDSKRAMDEYTSQIFLGGHNTIVLHNTCEDSLLAAPLIIDLVIMAELFERITLKAEDREDFEPLHPVLSILGYFLKAPMVPPGEPVVNALFKQRAALENVMRVCAGLPTENNMDLENRKFRPFVPGQF